MNLKKQGYFKEMPHGETTDPSIMDFIGSKSDAGRVSEICHYLDSGVMLVACYGVSYDVIEPSRGIAGNPSMLTDGEWVWPGDLSYYVSTYSLKLDEEFLKTMEKNHWKVSLTDELDYDLIEIEGKKLID